MLGNNDGESFVLEGELSANVVDLKKTSDCRCTKQVQLYLHTIHANVLAASSLLSEKNIGYSACPPILAWTPGNQHCSRCCLSDVLCHNVGGKVIRFSSSARDWKACSMSKNHVSAVFRIARDFLLTV